MLEVRNYGSYLHRRSMKEKHVNLRRLCNEWSFVLRSAAALLLDCSIYVKKGSVFKHPCQSHGVCAYQDTKRTHPVVSNVLPGLQFQASAWLLSPDIGFTCSRIHDNLVILWGFGFDFSSFSITFPRVLRFVMWIHGDWVDPLMKIWTFFILEILWVKWIWKLCHRLRDRNVAWLLFINA